VRILQVSLDQIRTNKKLIPLKVGRWIKQCVSKQFQLFPSL
jgi:hypothetical protein